MTKRITWNEENTAQLEAAVAGQEVVTQAALEDLAGEFETTKRSVGAKLRKMGYAVEKASEVAKSGWDADQEAELVALLNGNPGAMTFAELAASFAGGQFSAKQIQGKILSLELTHTVKPTPKKEAVRSYSEEEEATYVSMAEAGSSLEDIADALGKSLASARGKGLSLFKEGRIAKQPTQVTSTANATKVDYLAGLDLENMSVADIAEATQKSERGIKSALSRRGLNCEDYKGADKRAKLDAAKDAE